MPQNTKLLQMGGSIQFISAGEQYFDIPRWGVLYQLVLRIAFTITTGGGAAPSGPLYQTLSRVVRNLQIVVNGRDYIYNLPGETIAMKAFRDFGIVPFGTDAALPSATNTAYNYVIYLPVTLYLPRGVRKSDSGLNLGTPRIAGLPAQLKVTWANTNCSDLFGTPAGAVLSNVSCTVAGEYETDPSPTFNDGPDAGKPRFWLTRVQAQELVNLPASNTAFSVIIDEGTGVFLKNLQIETLVDNVGADNVLNNGAMSLKAGNLVYGDLTAGMLKAQMQRAIQANPQAGTYDWDFTQFGSLMTMIDTRRSALPANLILYMDATKQGTTTNLAVTRDGIRNLLAA
jgi:hypothetical protein